jgi:hypothetical protein
MQAAACLRCGGANESDDLVCVGCSQTRVRAVLPSTDLVEPPFTQADAALFGDLFYDAQLDEAEAAAGETAWGLIVRIQEHMGGDTQLWVEVLLAPEGPATPPEDLWGTPVVLAHLPTATRQSVQERIDWARHTTTVRHLRPVDVDERRVIARRGFLGAPEGLPLLLAARQRLASLAFESVVGAPVVSRVTREGDREVLSCEVHVKASDGRKKPVVVELFASDAATLDPRLVAAAASFCK